MKTENQVVLDRKGWLISWENSFGRDLTSCLSSYVCLCGCVWCVTVDLESRNVGWYKQKGSCIVNYISICA